MCVCACVCVVEICGEWGTCPVGTTRSCPAGLPSRKSHCASWMLLISFLLDIAIGTMTKHLNICHKLGESRPQAHSHPCHGEHLSPVTTCPLTSGRPSSVTPNCAHAHASSRNSPAVCTLDPSSGLALFPIFVPSLPWCSVLSSSPLCFIHLLFF